MKIALTYGYIYIERGTGNEIQLAVKLWNIGIHYKPITEPLSEGDYFHTHMMKVVRYVACRNIYFKTKSDAELFLDRMHTLNAAGGMTLEVRTNSGVMPGSLLNFISGKTAIEVTCLDINPLSKVAYGDGTVYKVNMCKFQQIAKFA